MGLLPRNHANPARDVRKFKERKRSRWVGADEMPRLLEAIAEYPDAWLRSFFLLLLLTGMRRGELINARRQDFNPRERTLLIRETKNGEPYTVRLSTAAAGIIETLPRKPGNPYLFPGRRPGRPLAEPKRAWDKIRERAGLPDVRIHDLRRTFGSWLTTSGISMEVVSKLLNHSSIKVTESVYAHLADDPLREAVEGHGAKIVELAKARERRAGMDGLDDPN